MKASIFIKAALIDQMQIIADAGLWFHLAKLIPPGVEVLAKAKYGQKKIENIPHLIDRFYRDVAPEYLFKVPTGSKFICDKAEKALCDGEEYLDFHLKEIDGVAFVHVPTWFNDFKGWCENVLVVINENDLLDIDVFPDVKPLEA